MKSMRVLAAILGIWALFLQAGAQVYEFPTENRWVDSVFNSLTREEKIGQVIMASATSAGPEKNSKEILKLIKDNKIGGVIFFKGTPEAQASLTNAYQKKSKTPLLVAIDGEWGVAMRLSNVVKFSRQMGLAAANNDSLVYQMGVEVAKQCKMLGIHINFAPVADINNNPGNPVINDRSFGDDKYTVARLSELYMKGMQDNGVLACLKHFPGHGDTKTDSHLDLPEISYSFKRLDTLELYPFKQLINKGAASIMVAHMHIPAFDSTPNLSVSLSPNLVDHYLKYTLGFKGLVFTDALTMKGVAAYYTQPEIAIKALQAGNDVLLCPTQIPKVIKAIGNALDTCGLDSVQFYKSVKKILAAKYQMGLTTTPQVSLKDIQKRINPPSAIALQEEMATQQITVVKNHKKLLPLKSPEKKKIASIALGFTSKTDFQRMLGNYARMDYYQYGMGVDSIAFAIALQGIKEKNYDLIIVSIQNTNRSPDKFYGINPAAIGFTNRLKTEENVLLVSFGLPYNLLYFPEFKNLIVGYQDTEINQEKAAQLIFGAVGNHAHLPVNISEEYPKHAGVPIDTVKQILHYTTPEALGYKSADFERLDAVINQAIRKKALPGCQLLVAKGNNVIYSKAYGYATYDKKTPITADMLYDIASMSKVMGTTLAVMKLYEKGEIDLDKPVSKYLKDLKKTNKKDITIRQLLTHTAGLKAWIPFYKATLGDTARFNNIYCQVEDSQYVCKVADNLYIRDDYRDTLWQIIMDSEVSAPGKYVYSDLGFLILQRLVEGVAEEPLNVFVEKNFYKPLGLGTMTYLPLEKFERSQIAPTEDDKEFRKQLVWGYVHDPAAAMLGGVAGHAGIFSNSNDVAVVLQMLLNNGEYAGKRYFKKETVELFTAKQLDECRRGLGWDKPEPDKSKGNPTADVVPCSAFGHSGFTGTICWADPENGITYIFLSNRVYPSAENNLITKTNVRTKLHEIIYEIMGVK
jgi:beta-N-acetylhexosaminidase